jgi:hypothetical protein
VLEYDVTQFVAQAVHLARRSVCGVCDDEPLEPANVDGGRRKGAPTVAEQVTNIFFGDVGKIVKGSNRYVKVFCKCRWIEPVIKRKSQLAAQL